MIKFATLTGNRPKAACVFSLVLAACLLLFLPGCQGPLGMQDTARTGTLSVTVEGPPGAQARTILPDGLVSDFDRLRFVFSDGPSAFAPVTRPGDLGPITIDNIPVGTWNLTVHAYLEESGTDVLTASYTYTGLVITDTGPPNIPSRILPLNPEVGGSGMFEWNVNVPSDVSVAIDIFDFDAWVVGGASPITSFLNVGTGNVTLLAGTYWVVFRLSDGTSEALPIGMILRVYRNMVSSLAETFDFEPATPAERAIYTINNATWTPVNQPWSATAVGYALATVQDQVDYRLNLAGIIAVTATVAWYPAAPTPGETGATAEDIVFTVMVGSYSTEITVSVTFLPSHAQAALTAITGALGTIQAPFTQPWLADGTATLNAAIAMVAGQVNAAITNATASVSFADPPNPTGDGIPATLYVFNVVITGNDITTSNTTVTVSITFAADGVVVVDALEALRVAALSMFGAVVSSNDGANVPMASQWTTEALRNALMDAIVDANTVLTAHQNDNATQDEVNYAYGVLRSAYTAVSQATRLGRQELVVAHGALGSRVVYIAPQAGNYTPASWALVAGALDTANNLLATSPLYLGLDDEDLLGILTDLVDALSDLNAVFGVARVLVADYDAVNDAYTAATGALSTTAANEAAVVAAVTIAIDDASITVVANLTTTVDAGPGVPGSITGTITLSRGNASRTITVNVTIPALPVPGSVVITWTGFTNPLLEDGYDVGYSVVGNTITLVNHDGLDIRWFDGINEITGYASGGVLTMARLPSFVTVRATVNVSGIGYRTFSFVIETDD